MRHALGAAAIALAAVLVSPARAEGDEPEPPRIYECAGADGATVYQDDPCPEPPPAPARKAAPVRKATQIAKIVTPPPKSKSAPAPTPPPKFTGRLPSDEEWARIAAINGRPGSGAMGTPERVWDAFVTALRAGDRAAAARCLGTATAPALESWTPQELQSRGNAYSALVIKNNVGPQRVAGATRRNGRVTWVFFERAAGGEWRIVSM